MPLKFASRLVCAVLVCSFWSSARPVGDLDSVLHEMDDAAKIQIYQPRLDQVDIYDAGAHRDEFESFLVLGFGGSGHDMLKSFDVNYAGTEKIDGTETAKLDLTPKSEKVRQHFAHILLWIDPQRGLSLQQKLFETSGDYRLAKYSSVQINQKISDDKFKLKTSGKTKTLTH